MEYRPTAISRTSLTLSNDPGQQELTVTLPMTSSLAQLYLGAGVPPGERVTLTLRQAHRTDPSAESVVLYKGVVRSVKFENNAKVAKVLVAPISAALRRSFPNRNRPVTPTSTARGPSVPSSLSAGGARITRY